MARVSNSVSAGLCRLGCADEPHAVAGARLGLPERVPAWQPKLQHWAGLIASGRANEFKETALLPDFLTDIFCGLLGYTGPAEAADTYTLSRERHVEVDGKFSDAVLGRFQKDKEQFIAVLEGKGTRNPRRRPVCRAAHVRHGPGLTAPFAKTAACSPPNPLSAPSEPSGSAMLHAWPRT